MDDPARRRSNLALGAGPPWTLSHFRRFLLGFFRDGFRVCEETSESHRRRRHRSDHVFGIASPHLIVPPVASASGGSSFSDTMFPL